MTWVVFDIEEDRMHTLFTLFLLSLTILATEGWESGDRLVHNPVRGSLLAPPANQEIIQQESEVPRHIIEAAMIPPIKERVLEAPSAIIERFIVESLHGGADIDTEGLIEKFFQTKIEEKVEDFLKEIEEISNEINWQEIEKETVENVKPLIIVKLREFGVPEEKIKEVEKISMTFARTHIFSSTEAGAAVYVSRYQMVRFALDYQKIFGTSFTLQELVRIFSMTVMAHELGHKIDEILGYISSRIALEWQSFAPMNHHERFAEFWADMIADSIGVGEVARNFKRFLATQVEKVWEEVRSYNKDKGSKVGFVEVFRRLISQVRTWAVSDFIAARVAIYTLAPPENRVFPFSEEKIRSAIRQMTSKQSNGEFNITTPQVLDHSL